MTTPFDRRYFLLIGIALWLLVVASTLTGQTFQASRYRPGIVDRSEKPKQFCWNVVLYFLGGLFFIGLYLYRISN